MAFCTTKRLFGPVICTLVIIAPFLVTPVAKATEVIVRVDGTIVTLTDPADKLGYGGTAVGRTATIFYIYNTEDAPPDFYGGARFPREADYFSDVHSSDPPSWMSSYIQFDNGERYSPDDYLADFATRDQVKIIERDGGAPYDYILFSDEKLGLPLIGGNLTTLIFEYTDNLVSGLSLEQHVSWSGDESDYPESRARFVFVDFSQGWQFSGYLQIDRLVVSPDALPVEIDIKPGANPNAINPTSGQKIPVAVLTTESFDAIQVDWEAVSFGRIGATEFHERAHVEDVDMDGDMDMVLHFDAQYTGIACGDTEATLIGETFSGEAITGTDSIVTVNCD